MLLVIGGLVLVTHLRIRDWTVNMDLKIYAIGAHEILHGRQLYTDIWDLKPPAVMLTYMAYELIFGYGQHTLSIMAITCNLLIVLGIYRLAVASRMGPWAGLAGALIWALQCGDVKLELHNANTEYFINVWMLWSFVGMASLVFGKPGKWVPWAVGFCWLAASMYKHSIVVGMIPLALMYLLLQYKMGAFKSALRDVLIWGGIGITGWVLLFGYFAIMGRFDDLYFTLITYCRTYGGSIVNNLAVKTNYSFLLHLMGHFKQMILLFALNMVGLIWLVERIRRQQVLLFVGMFSFSYLASMSLVDTFEHYFQYVILTASIGAGWSLAMLIESPSRLPRWLVVTMGVWFVAGIFFTQMPNWQRTREQYDQSIPNRILDAEGRKLGLQLQKEMKPTDFLLVWGYRTEILFTAGTRSTSGVLMPNDATAGKYIPRVSRMIADNIRNFPPNRVVVCDRWIAHRAQNRKHPITQWIFDHFKRMPMSDDYPDFSVWEPRGNPADLPPVPLDEWIGTLEQ